MPQKERFSEDRLKELLARWHNGGAAFMLAYRNRCEIVHLIKVEVSKPGCKGAFKPVVTKALDPPLPYRTALFMDEWYHIHVLKDMRDPEAPDPRNEVDPSTGSTATEPKPPNPKPKPPLVPRVVLVLKGELAEAAEFVKQHDQYPDYKTAITEGFLRYYRQVSTPVPAIDHAGPKRSGKKKAGGLPHGKAA